MEVSPSFPFVSLGVSELPLRPNASEVALYSVCGVLLDD